MTIKQLWFKRGLILEAKAIVQVYMNNNYEVMLQDSHAGSCRTSSIKMVQVHMNNNQKSATSSEGSKA